MDHREEKLRQIRLEAERLALAPGCDTCFFQRNHLCVHPIIQETAPDLYKGGVKFIGAKSIEVMRAPEGLCGPMGDLHVTSSPQERAGRWSRERTTALFNKITAPWNEADWVVMLVCVGLFASRRGIILIPFVLIAWAVWRIFLREK